MPSSSSKLAWAAAGVFAIGAVAGLSAPSVLPIGWVTQQAARSKAAAAPASASTVALPLVAAPDYRAIVAQNQAAVVGITSTGQMKAPGWPQLPGNPFGPGPFNRGNDQGDPFFYFFRNIPEPQGNVPTHSLGSGFIISADGLVLTNAHVVDGANQVIVKLADHREFKGKVLGSDKTSDIAVLKIDAHGLPAVRLGDSDELAVGDYVLAIGAPFGLEQTATAGIVSAKARSLPGDGYVPFIQTDAAVNPGNSGGPLFDAAGAVVGINSQIYSNSGGYQGVAFAIPINLAEQVEDQIVKTGKVLHGRLGVEVQSLDQALARSFKLQSPEGALVSKVEPGSAAVRAGMQAGDVILNYAGKKVTSAGQLSMLVNTTAPGKHATLEVWRAGEPLTLSALIGTTAVPENAATEGAPSEQTRLGLTLRPLTPEERQQVGVAGGLEVENARGRAAEAGIQPGDVVLSVDGTAVGNVPQLRNLVHDHDQVALLIQRGDSRIFVPVDLS